MLPAFTYNGMMLLVGWNALDFIYRGIEAGGYQGKKKIRHGA